MPKSCAARQCCNRYSNRRKQLTFHRFPFSRPELLKEWVLNIGRAGFKPKQHTVICSEHFRPECFSAFGNRKNLKHNAVPTVFAFQDSTQPVRENTNRARERGDAGSQGEKALWPSLAVAAYAGIAQGRMVAAVVSGVSLPRHPACRSQVCPEAGAEEDGPRKSMDIALEELQLPPNTEGPLQQVLPQRSEAAEAPGWPASPAGLKRALPMQASDHSYALLDLDALKKKLFFTLKENEKLRKRLKAQRLVMQRMSSRLRTHRGGQQGPQARPRPEQRS
nr:THAP domain-containing protein 3 isoform X3 [Marmota flaviventris]